MCSSKSDYELVHAKGDMSDVPVTLRLGVKKGGASDPEDQSSIVLTYSQDWSGKGICLNQEFVRENIK